MYSGRAREDALLRLATGASLSEVSRATGISRSSLRSWRSSGGARRGGDCPHCDGTGLDGPAYSALLGYYLGDGCVSVRRRYAVLRISCDAAYPRIVADVEGVTEAVHPSRPTFRVRAPGVTVVQSHWTHWPCLFPQHGPGRKHERVLGMQDWQWAVVEQHPADFLRGLFHSDGARVRNWTTRMVDGERKRYDYPRWQFVNVSTEIMGWCCEALDLVGVEWRRSNHKTISVSRRVSVARLDALIGPKA